MHKMKQSISWPYNLHKYTIIKSGATATEQRKYREKINETKIQKENFLTECTNQNPISLRNWL